METLYLISVVGSVCALAMITCGISSFLACVFGGYRLAANETDKNYGRYRKLAKRFLIISIISAIIACVLPTKRECLFIYGGGSVIEYVQNNDSAKVLPDKAIEALNLWLDSKTQTK